MFKDQDLKNKKVLVRVDFNVPLNKSYEVTDDNRIRSAIPTVRELTERGARVILMSHLGRPLKDLNEDGSFKEKYTLRHIVSMLEQLSGLPVTFITEPIGSPDLKKAIDQAPEGHLVLLENTRFYKGEEKGDVALAENMAGLAEYFVNDAFGAAHREHASTATIARYYHREHKSFGPLMDREVSNISKVLDQVERPFIAILGGAKVSDKISLIENLLDKVNTLLVGGGMAFTFIKAMGGNIGDSLCENDKLELARQLMDTSRSKGVDLVFPVDAVIADKFDNGAEIKTTPVHEIPDGWSGLDIGPETIQLFKEKISPGKTILWNGPMGVFEMPNFATGTLEIARELARVTREGAFTIVGGGDSVAAVSQAGLDDDVSFVSTGGGAMLEMIEGKQLPGITFMHA